MTQTFYSTSADMTVRLGETFGAQLQRGDIVALYGDLGSGKTQFVKGVCRAFHVQGSITSPSFVILNRYEGVLQQKVLMVYHFDLYRVKHISEIYDLGYEEYLRGDDISLIEWADVLGDLLPPRRYDIRFTLGEQDCDRQIEISVK